MLITLHTKGGAVLAERRLEGPTAVPRVGEYIEAPAYGPSEDGLSFLVTEVRYLLNAGELEAMVTAIARGDDPSIRVDLLTQAGWLVRNRTP